MSRRFWTPDEDAVMRDRYPVTPTSQLARELGRTERSVYMRSNMLGLRKDERYMTGPESGRLNGRDTRGVGSRFQHGHKTWNAGMKGWQAGGMSVSTQFKPGHRGGMAAEKYQPIGSVRISKDGYSERKMHDGLPMQSRWRAEHLLLWEADHGPVPEGHAVVFRNTDRTDVRLENLEIITRAELMRRNSYHNRYPKEVQLAIQARGALNRQINKRAAK